MITHIKKGDTIRVLDANKIDQANKILENNTNYIVKDVDCNGIWIYVDTNVGEFVIFNREINYIEKVENPISKFIEENKDNLFVIDNLNTKVEIINKSEINVGDKVEILNVEALSILRGFENGDIYTIDSVKKYTDGNYRMEIKLKEYNNTYSLYSSDIKDGHIAVYTRLK